MKVSSHHRQHRITRLLTVALAVAALAAPTASAMPAPVDQPAGRHRAGPCRAGRRPGFDWDSAAIGAGGAGALLLLVSLGGFTYRWRHHDMRINHCRDPGAVAFRRRRPRALALRRGLSRARGLRPAVRRVPRGPLRGAGRAARDEPVFYAPSLDYYVVTRYADVEAVFLDPKTYSAATAQLPLVKLEPEALKILAEGGHRPAALDGLARPAGAHAPAPPGLARVHAAPRRGDGGPHPRDRRRAARRDRRHARRSTSSPRSRSRCRPRSCSRSWASRRRTGRS